MTGQVPFDANSDWTNPYCDNTSNDPLVDKLIGNAYHVVRTVYCNLGNLKLIYDFLNQYGMVLGVQSEAELKAMTTSAPYVRLYGFDNTNKRVVTDYLYVDGDRTGVLPDDPAATGSWILVATSGSDGEDDVGKASPPYIPYIYNNGSAIGGETTIAVPVGTVGVPFIIIEGHTKTVTLGYTYDPSTLTVTLAQPLEIGDEVVLLLTGTPAVPDNPNVSDWIQINWLYNAGYAVGGEQVIAVPFTFESVPAIYKNGLRYYAGLAAQSYTIDKPNQRILLTEPLATNDRLIVTLGGESVTFVMTDRTIQEIARAYNFTDNKVILSTNTSQYLNGMKVIYDVVAQKSYGVPTVPNNSYIISVSNGQLTYAPGNVTVNLPVVPSDALDNLNAFITSLLATPGAGKVGYDENLVYSDNTVGVELQNQASDIDVLESKLPDAVKTLATVLKKMNDGTAITISCYGDSLTYGQDTTATGGQPPINGATQGRSPNPYPESLATSLSTIGISATVVNRGFPGDTSADGLTRWASAGSSDVSIIMYGTNDAMNYGGTGLVSVDDFRKNISSMIERERGKGAVVILMSSPNVAERVANAKIAPYRAQMKYLADAYSLTYIDASEQIETMTKQWTDNVHLTSFAYNELGWHIASLFANREGSIERVCAGQIFHPTDHIGYGGGTSFQVVAGSKGNNFLINLGVGQIYAIGVYCAEDVIPVIHSVNSQGANSGISAYYSGTPSSTSGVKTAGLAHQSSLGYRQKLTAQKLSKGYRTLYLLNNGTVPAYIEAVEFQSLSQPAMTLGFFSKSDALSGIHQPARVSNATNGWVAVDTSRMLTSDCQFCARLTLGTEAIGGLALMNGFQNAPNNFTDNAILAIRSGAILGIREIVNGVVGADTPASGVFPATGTWTGEIEMEIVGTTCNVYVDGVLKVTKTGITVNRGYPAVYGQTNQRLACHSALIKGYTKALYE